MAVPPRSSKIAEPWSAWLTVRADEHRKRIELLREAVATLVEDARERYEALLALRAEIDSLVEQALAGVIEPRR